MRVAEWAADAPVLSPERNGPTGVAGAQVEPPPERTVQPGPVIIIPTPECLLAHVLDPTANRVTGGPDDDVLSVTPGRDIVDGVGGDDTIDAGGDLDDENDKLDGGRGRDFVSGGNGNDKSLKRGDDNDRLDGGNGRDLECLGADVNDVDGDLDVDRIDNCEEE